MDRTTVAAHNEVWLRGACEFATTFSYRLPRASSQFAIGVRVPSPAAIKLALVAAAIHENGTPSAGEPFFEQVRACTVCFGLPRRLARLCAFLKRLKPAQDSKGLQESTGTRDYFLLDSPLQIFIKISSNNAFAWRLIFFRT